MNIDANIKLIFNQVKAKYYLMNDDIQGFLDYALSTWITEYSDYCKIISILNDAGIDTDYGYFIYIHDDITVYDIPRDTELLLFDDSIDIISENNSCEGLEHLREVHLPQILNVIPKYMFRGCASLKKVNLPNTITCIEDQAFYRSGFDIIDLTNTQCQTIGRRCFMHCGDLIEVKLPNTVNVLGRHTFSYCSKLEKANIPINVTDLYTGILKECKSLKQLSVSKQLVDKYTDGIEDFTEFIFSQALDDTEISYIRDNILKII